MPSSQHVDAVCIFDVTLKAFHFLPGLRRKQYRDKTGQCITQHETEVIITYLGSYPEVEFLQPFTFTGFSHNLPRTRICIVMISRQDLPVVKGTVWKSLAASVGSQVSSKTCREEKN